MTRLSKLLTALLSLVFVGAAVRENSVSAQTAYINEIRGKVELKRKTWSEFHPVSRVGTPLSDGDQLRRASSAVVVIACPNGKKLPVRIANERLGLKTICPQWKAVVFKGPPPLISVGGVNAQIPYLIAPRRTLLLSRTPTLRWHPVPGATLYKVQVIGPQGTVWQTQVKEPQVTYMGQAALQAGIPYSVVIETNTGQSSQAEISAGTEFILLQEAEAKVVQAEVQQILQSDFSNEVKALKLVAYYRNYAVPNPSAYDLSEQAANSYRLSAEAITTLETLIAQEKQSPLIYRTLGDLYLQTGVVASAENAYLQAIASIQSLEDLEEWSVTLYGLGELYEVTQNRQQALIFYSQARAGFILLNDQRAEALNRLIDKLRK